MKHIYVINPAAGDGSHYLPLMEEIKRQYTLSGIPCGIYTTKGPGDAFRFLAGMKREESYRIIACGGDGTLNEVVNGIADYEEVELGLFPCGSGNDYIKNFINPENFLSVAKLMQAVPVPVDYIKTNIGNCLNICNLGLDAKVAKNFMKFKGLPKVSGPMAYNLSLPFSLLSKLGWKMTIRIDGEEFCGKKILTVIGGGFCYGGGYYSAPEARIDDGLIDFVAIEQIPRLQLPKFIGRYKKGSYLTDPDFEKILLFRKAEKIELVMSKPMPVCIDGECNETAVLTAEIVPAGIRFCVPEGSAITGFLGVPAADWTPAFSFATPSEFVEESQI